MSNNLDRDAIFASLTALKQQFGSQFLIGLSGGSDSLALAHLCAQWNEDNDARICALCIDHGFRATSAYEAVEAHKKATDLGIEAMIYTNTNPKLNTGLQAHARVLRHNAFAQRAHEMGGATILLGHTRDDQAETIAFRLARQTGLDGLAGMAPITHGLAVWHQQSFPIARPLLGAARTDLRAFLTSLGQTWCDDPSNQNTDFSRVKVRQRLAHLGQTDRLIRIGALAATLRIAIGEHTDALDARCGKGGDLIADLFLDAEPILQARLVYRHLVAAGAPDRPIEREKMDRLLRHMSLCNFAGATLGRVKVSRKNGLFSFTKAPERRNTATNRQID